MKVKGYYLITTDNWFIAPDGKSYLGVWGNVKIMQDSDILGIKTNAKSTNWFAIVGTEENHIIIAGCQIHYAAKCNKKPDKEMINCWSSKDKNFEQRPSKIYIAE